MRHDDVDHGTCLCPETAESIRASIVASMQEMDHCEAEITRLEHLPAREKARHEELLQSIEEREFRLRPPISRRLPFELLGKIFTLLYEAERRADWIHAGISRTPFVLATVCRFWRDAAVGTQALWSTIRLRLDDCEETGNMDEIPSIDERTNCQKREMLDIFLHRSGDQPSLKLFLISFGRPPINLLRTLSGVSSRVSHLDLEEMPDPFSALPSDLAVPSFNNLKSLVIRTEWLSSPWGLRHPIHRPYSWIGSARKLTHLRVLEGAFHQVGAEFWSELLRENIQHLTVQKYTRGSLSFSHFPQLLEARLQRIYPNSLELMEDLQVVTKYGPLRPTITPITPIRQLVLSCLADGGETLETIFTDVTSHDLESLELSGVDSYEPVKWPRYSFVEFAERSRLAASLTTFSLKGVRIPVQDLLQAFELLPSLTKLSLFELENFNPRSRRVDGPQCLLATTSCLESLTQPAALPLLPALTRLALRFIPDPSNVSRFGALGRLIKSRSSSDHGCFAALESVSVEFGPSSLASYNMLQSHVAYSGVKLHGLNQETIDRDQERWDSDSGESYIPSDTESESDWMTDSEDASGLSEPESEME
ncbi:hypothetical protein C8J56DRAFT_928620 [Mycena floridula]|nr:hypothetical protein C8J56DRAFT_928620 [Mycena floridula]